MAVANTDPFPFESKRHMLFPLPVETKTLSACAEKPKQKLNASMILTHFMPSFPFIRALPRNCESILLVLLQLQG